MSLRARPIVAFARAYSSSLTSLSPAVWWANGRRRLACFLAVVAGCSTSAASASAPNSADAQQQHVACASPYLAGSWIWLHQCAHRRKFSCDTGSLFTAARLACARDTENSASESWPVGVSSRPPLLLRGQAAPTGRRRRLSCAC